MRHPLFPAFIAMLFSLALSVVSSGALAQDAQRPGKLSPDCRQQMMTACPSAGDPKDRRECMMENFSKLTPSCQGEIKARMEAMKAWRQSHPKPAPNGDGMMPPPPPSPQAQ